MNPRTGSAAPSRELFPLAAELTAMIAATWLEDDEAGFIPALAVFASQADLPNDEVVRRVLIMPSGRVYQIPIVFSHLAHVGEA